MHPMERLRMVARAGREDASVLVREAASALAAFGDDPAALVTACRRLVDRQPTCGPMWWLAARVLSSADPAAEAWRAANTVVRDETPVALAAALPEGATIVVVGWPPQVAEALLGRGDVRALVVDAMDEGSALVRWLRRADGDAELVPESGVAAAVRASQLVVLEAAAVGGTPGPSGPLSGVVGPSGPLSGVAGPSGLVAASGSGAAAACGRQCGVPVWAVAGEGRVLPAPLWEALARRLATRGCEWTEVEEVVPLEWVDRMLGPGGPQPVADGVARSTCPPAPELLRGARR